MDGEVSTPRYHPAVRIGNWYENISIERDRVDAFKERRDRGELIVERTRRLFDNFHKDVELEAPKGGIPFDAIVQLVPPHMKNCENANKVQLALSVLINERVVRESQKISENCELSIAASIKPCVRNSFRVIACNHDTMRTDELLKYGQPFRLQCIETQNDEPLYLYCTPKSADLSTIIYSSYESRKCGELNLPLGLCAHSNCGPGKQIPAAFCNWICQHVDIQKRYEYFGKNIPPNEPLIITHSATNKNLAAEDIVIQTLFGPEFLVSVQNYKDVYKNDSWQNVWKLVNGREQFK